MAVIVPAIMMMSPTVALAQPAGWQLNLTGWPWWLVLLLASGAAWALVRLLRRELSNLSSGTRRQLLLLRGTAVFLLLLFLMEPALTRRIVEKVAPLVAVVVDQSGSMS